MLKKGMIMALSFASVLAFGTQATLATTTLTPFAQGGHVYSGHQLTNSAVTPFTVENVGGGTWNYDSSQSIISGSSCYSNYIHNTLEHSATSIDGQQNNKVYAIDGQWANSSALGNFGDSTSVYWDTY